MLYIPINWITVILAPKKELLRSTLSILNRICQTGSADEDQQKSIEDEMPQINEDFSIHREQAQKSHDYYNEIKSRCQTDWKRICELEKKQNKSNEENQILENFRHNFTVVLSADF